MVNMKISKQMTASAEKIADVLCDHENLSRFLNAKITISKPENTGERKGGIGCHRKISMLGLSFKEEILIANNAKIQYRIIGNKPLKNHLGTIELIQNEQGTKVDYTIVGEARFFIPACLITKLLTHDFTNFLNKIECHLNAS